MINLIQPITVQQAYDGITHARWWASWNWWWRKVDDDDGDGFPSPEPRTDSRSAPPRENRAWRRLYIVKRDESFSLIFSPESEYMWVLDPILQVYSHLLCVMIRQPRSDNNPDHSRWWPQFEEFMYSLCVNALVQYSIKIGLNIP